MSAVALRARDLDGRRILHEPARELPDVFRVRRREHQVLPHRRQQLQHPLDGVDEAHVEHAIRFIEHEAFDVAQVDRALLGEIEQAARRRDQEVATVAKRVDLRVDAHAAEHDDGAQVEIFAVGPRVLGDLCGELARGREHQGARRTVGNAPVELRENRQHERGGLARAGLRAREHIAVGEHGRDGLGLDGGGRVVALFGNGTQQLGRQPEIRKYHVSKNL